MTAVPRKAPLLSLHPGDWYFGADYQRLHTVLGSCVALSVWHPQHKIGGMCHYLLPKPANNKVLLAQDCRYASNALPRLGQAMLAVGGYEQFQISLFGGGDMFAFSTPTSIGFENLAYARQWIGRQKIQLHRLDLGGTISRSVSLWLDSGEIELKRYSMNES